MNESGRYDDLHGDEDEIDHDARQWQEEYELAQADDWKYE